MDLLIRVLVVALVAGCVSSEGDVLSSARGDGGGTVGDGDGGVVDGDGSVGCPTLPACPTPPLGDITVCGAVVSLETSLRVTEGAPDVRVFDLLELRFDPLNATELARVAPDECGFYSTTVDGSTGLVVVHTGDLPDFSGPTDYRGVAAAVDADPGNVVRTNAWILHQDIEQQWSNDAEILGSFAGAGSVLNIFVDVTQPAVGPLQGTPVSGVAITSSGPGPADDYYFDDADALRRSSIELTQEQTGANGSALVRATIQLSTYSGDKAGCNFGEAQGLGIPGLIQVQEISGTCN